SVGRSTEHLVQQCWNQAVELQSHASTTPIERYSLFVQRPEPLLGIESWKRNVDVWQQLCRKRLVPGDRSRRCGDHLGQSFRRPEIIPQKHRITPCAINLASEHAMISDAALIGRCGQCYRLLPSHQITEN